MAQVIRVHTAPYTLPFERPLSTARGTVGERHGTLIIAEDDRGRQGVGDVAPWPGFGAGPESVARALLEERPQSALVEKSVEFATVGEVETGCEATPEVAFGASLALLDLVGQHQNQPIAAFLGSPAPQVRSHALVRDAKDARDAAGRGYTHLKIKVGSDPWEHDFRRVRAVHEVAPNARLRLDVNGAWDCAQTEHASRSLRDLPIDWIEQPVAADAWKSLIELRPHLNTAIALDESVHNAGQLSAILDAGAADAVVLKPMAVGGTLACFQLAQHARARGVRVAITHSLESAVGRAAALHLASLFPEEVHGLRSLLAHDLGTLPDPGPQGPVPSGPGLGLTLDIAAKAPGEWFA